MEREREGFEPPPGKRARMTSVPAGGGEAVSPRSQKLLGHTPFVVLFIIMARMTVRNKAAAGVRGNSTSERPTPAPQPLEQLVQSFFYAIHEFREIISSKLDTLQSKMEAFQAQAESKLDALQGQVDGLRHEMRQQPAHLHSNRHAGDRHSGLGANQEHATANGSNTNTRLCFLNDLKPPIYTGKNITDENNAPIKVAIFEGDEMITSGPLSKVKVEILVLRGDLSNDGRDDWTEAEFDRLKVPGREGQDQMLGTARLRKGVAELTDVRFREGSCRRKLIMGARVCKSEKTTVRIREALTKPVTVLDRRNEPNEKRHPPRLDDEVYRLEEIAKNGAYHKRLEKKGISTVQGLLKALNRDSDELRKILEMENQHSAWSKMTKHANDCLLQEKPGLKRYQNEEENVVLYFNCVHGLVGAAFPHDYVDAKGFGPRQNALVDNCKGHAYETLEDIQPNYVMTNNIPELVSPGTGAARNCPRDVNNHVTEPTFLTPNYSPMITGHDSDAPITQDYQGQTSLPHGQQQILPTSTGSDWQQNPQGAMDSPGLLYQVDIASMFDFDIASMLQDPAGPSTSGQPYFESHHLP